MTTRSIFGNERASLLLMAALAVSFAFWMIIDPRVAQALDRPFAGDSIGIRLGVGLGLASALGCLVYPLITSKRCTLRHGLASCLMIAVFCGLYLRRSGLRWMGYEWRAEGHVAKLDELALRLSRDWPREDGEVDGLGPFTSYPFDRPSVLLLLSPFPLESTQTVVASIERTDDASLLFQLGGKDTGIWLHWNSSGLEPRAHTSGLSQERLPRRFTALSESWTIVDFEEL
ncbi:MAG: hypothetical protein AAF664_10335 [Planctomycetota bacterium]